ncbi:MAG: hypothetical protein KAR38_06175, partial [Calditrichia bacterium]|nr:hypothetical protein [Calditrichia bacterium]
MDEEGDDALQFNPVSSPFNPNTGSGSGSQYLGVFLNQQIQDGIYYSLNAPESQEFSVNGKLLTWYFYGWEKEGALLENENSNNTTVVFTSYNANVNALYKGHLASSTPNATANNNGFHLQPRPAGSYSGLQMVYEDGGQIYRTYQTGAEDWEPENRLSNGNENSINSEPAIYNLFNTDGNQGNEYAAVWNRYNNIMGEHQLVYYGLSSVPKGTKDATAIKDATASSELHPSVAGYAHNGLNTGVVAYKDNAGIQLWFSRDDHLHPVSSSTYADFPTLECRKMEEIAGKFTSYYQLAWQEDDGIHFRKFRREDDTGPVDTYGDIILNSGISLLSDNIKPAICQKIGDYTFSVWQGQYLHKAKFGIKAKVGDYSPAICFRQLTGENTWGPVEIFTMSGNSADNPVVTAWDNGSSYDVLIAWDLNGTTSYFRRINGNWDSFYGFYMEGKNPAVTVKDNIPYLACTESIQEPYRILNEQISTSAKKKEQLLPPHKRLLSLDFSNNKENRFDFPLAIEVGDLQYYNADSINLIYPEYKDTLVTVSNAFVYKQFNVEPGFTHLEIPFSIYLEAGKSFPQLKGDYLNFKIFDAKNGKELKTVMSLTADKLKSHFNKG